MDLNPLEKRKQEAEVQAWLALRETKGNAFLQGTRVEGDLAVYRNAVIVDVGCGPRPFVERFPAHAAFMFDCCMRAYVREGLLDAGSRRLVLCAEAMAEALPVRDESVDHVFCINMLDHTYEPGRVVAEFHRILKPWGYVHLNVDLGGLPNDCEPTVFDEARVAELFAGFEDIYTELRPPSNPGRDAMLIRMYRKPRSESTPRERLAMPHGSPPGPVPPVASGRFSAKYFQVLACPRCRGSLVDSPEAVVCSGCERPYPVEDGVPVLIP